MSTRLVALTGATGFIGRNVLRQLLGAGFHVRALVRSRPAWLAALSSGVTPVDGALDDPGAISALLAGCDTVVHVAGAIRGAHYGDFASVNVEGTRRIVEAARASTPAMHVLAVSSLAARAPALSCYAASKHAAESVVATSERFTIVRPPAVYGPDDPALATLWRWLARGWLLRPAPVDARFSLLHVTDLADAVVRLVRHGATGRTLTLDDGRPDGYDWRLVARIAARQRGRPVRTIAVPTRMLSGVAALNLRVSGLAGRTPLFTPGKVRELSHPDWVCDNVALRQLLGWAPAIRLEHALPTLPGWATSAPAATPGAAMHDMQRGSNESDSRIR